MAGCGCKCPLMMHWFLLTFYFSVINGQVANPIVLPLQPIFGSSMNGIVSNDNSIALNNAGLAPIVPFTRQLDPMFIVSRKSPIRFGRQDFAETDTIHPKNMNIFPSSVLGLTPENVIQAAVTHSEGKRSEDSVNKKKVSEKVPPAIKILQTLRAIFRPMLISQMNDMQTLYRFKEICYREQESLKFTLQNQKNLQTNLVNQLTFKKSALSQSAPSISTVEKEIAKNEEDLDHWKLKIRNIKGLESTLKEQKTILHQQVKSAMEYLANVTFIFGHGADAIPNRPEDNQAFLETGHKVRSRTNRQRIRRHKHLRHSSRSKKNGRSGNQTNDEKISEINNRAIQLSGSNQQFSKDKAKHMEVDVPQKNDSLTAEETQKIELALGRIFEKFGDILDNDKRNETVHRDIGKYVQLINETSKVLHNTLTQNSFKLGNLKSSAMQTNAQIQYLDKNLHFIRNSIESLHTMSSKIKGVCEGYIEAFEKRMGIRNRTLYEIDRTYGLYRAKLDEATGNESFHVSTPMSIISQYSCDCENFYKGRASAKCCADHLISEKYREEDKHDNAQ